MELYGTIAVNLGLAIKSARRFRGRPVHADTIAYWEDLLSEAHNGRNAEAMLPSLDVLISDLQSEIKDRSATSASIEAEVVDPVASNATQGADVPPASA